MLVRIKKCSNTVYWYNHSINHIFEVQDEPKLFEGKPHFVLKAPLGGTILYDDAEFVTIASLEPCCLICTKPTHGTYAGKWSLCFKCYNDNPERVLKVDAAWEIEHSTVLSLKEWVEK